MTPQTSTHYGIGITRKIYYRKKQVPIKVHTHGSFKHIVKYEFYCSYTDKWINAIFPHELVEL